MMWIDDVVSAGVCPNYGGRFQHADILNLAADVTDGGGSFCHWCRVALITWCSLDADPGRSLRGM